MRPTGAPQGWTDPAITVVDEPVWRRWLPLLTWLGCLASAIVALRWLGGAGLATPPLQEPSAWADWLATTEPVTATVAVLRVLAIGLAWYLTGVTSISVVARLLEAASLIRLADALSVGPVRVLVQQAVGVGLAASVLATAVPAAAPTAAEAEVAVMVPITDERAPEAVAAAGLALREPVPAPIPAPSTAVHAEAAGSPGVTDGVQIGEVAAPAMSEVEPRPTLRERKIAAGDHFWAIAEEEVAAQLGRPGTEDEVLEHWETLLVVNADRLVVAGNADLLLPGQTIVLPDVAEVTP